MRLIVTTGDTSLLNSSIDTNYHSHSYAIDGSKLQLETCQTYYVTVQTEWGDSMPSHSTASIFSTECPTSNATTATSVIVVLILLGIIVLAYIRYRKK